MTTAVRKRKDEISRRRAWTSSVEEKVNVEREAENTALCSANLIYISWVGSNLRRMSVATDHARVR